MLPSANHSPRRQDVDPTSEEYIFRPYGFQPGHSVEWAKLLLLLERCVPVGDAGAVPATAVPASHLSVALGPHPRVMKLQKLWAAAAAAAAVLGQGGPAAAEPWLLETAELLFTTAVECGWDAGGGGGFCYTFGGDGAVLDSAAQNRSAAAETIGVLFTMFGACARPAQATTLPAKFLDELLHAIDPVYREYREAER